MQKLIPFNAETRSRTGFSHKVIIDFAAIALGGANTTLTVQLVPGSTLNVTVPGTGTFPAGMTCLRVAINLITAFDFSDAAINSLLLEIGDGGSTARYMAQTEIAVDGTEVPFKVGQTGFSYLVADGIDAKFTVAGGASPTMAECTSGKVEIYLSLVDLNDLAVPI